MFFMIYLCLYWISSSRELTGNEGRGRRGIKQKGPWLDAARGRCGSRSAPLGRFGDARFSLNNSQIYLFSRLAVCQLVCAHLCTTTIQYIIYLKDQCLKIILVF